MREYITAALKRLARTLIAIGLTIIVMFLSHAGLWMLKADQVYMDIVSVAAGFTLGIILIGTVYFEIKAVME